MLRRQWRQCWSRAGLHMWGHSLVVLTWKNQGGLLGKMMTGLALDRPSWQKSSRFLLESVTLPCRREGFQQSIGETSGKPRTRYRAFFNRHRAQSRPNSSGEERGGPCRQCLYIGQRVFLKNPSLRLLSAYTLLGKGTFFLGASTRCIFLVALREPLGGWTGWGPQEALPGGAVSSPWAGPLHLGVIMEIMEMTGGL